MEEMLVKDRIIDEYIRDLIEVKANEVVDDEDAERLTSDEQDTLLTAVKEKYCDGCPLYQIDKEALFDGSVCSFVAAKVAQIIKDRARVYTVPFMLSFNGSLTVKANSKEEATEWVENMSLRDLAQYIDDDSPEDLEVRDFDVSDEGTVEEYGTDYDEDAID